MFLGELFDKYQWKDVRYRFLKLYPDEKKSIKGYCVAYKQIQFMSHVRFDNEDMKINIERRHSGNDLYFGVFGNNGHPDIERYALEFEPWEKWVGMEINKHTLNGFREIDIICHCLFDMTFHGFDRHTAKENTDDILVDLDERVDQIEKWKEEGTLDEHTTSFEELKKELNEKYKGDKQ